MEVCYRQGGLSSAADHLSLYPLDDQSAPVNLVPCASLTPLLTVDVQKSQADDSFCARVIRTLKGATNTLEYKTRIQN